MPKVLFLKKKKTVTSDDDFLCSMPPTQTTEPCRWLRKKEKDAVELRQGRKRPKGDDERNLSWTFYRLCLNKTDNRNGYETVGSSFRGNLVLRLQNSSEWPPAGQHKSALPCLNDLHTQEERRTDIGKTMERERDKWRRFSFFKRLSMDYQTFWVFGCLLWVKRKSSLTPLMVCDFAHLQCTVKFEKEDAPLLTNYLYARTFAFCVLQYKRKNKKDILMIWGHARVQCGLVLCNHKYHNLNVCFFFFFVNVILIIHVSYYITVYLNYVKSCIWFGYMCARRRCESQYRKMLYFCYEIY